jgi:uncharacterized membrane protein YkoI
MIRSFVFCGFLISASLLADTKMPFDRLPAAVQSSAKANARGAEIVGASKEVENGQTSYEVETKLGGKSRDLSFDQSGKLLAIEEEVTSGALPPAAWAAIQKRAAGGVVKKIESITQGTAVSYEAVVKTKSGKNREIAVNADGTLHRD